MAVVEVQRPLGTRRLEAAMQSLRTSVQAVAVCVRDADGETLGDALIQIREAGIDPLEAIFAPACAASTSQASTRLTARSR